MQLAARNQSRSAGGLPASRIVVKPNFVDLEAPVPGIRTGFLFVGRLAAEKGIGVLARAVRDVPSCRTTIVGSGPEDVLLREMPGVQLLGQLDGDAVRQRMASAAALILPSICYENFPRTLVEAFACGLPVIASRIGALAGLIDDGVTGLLFESGNAADLAEKMRWAEANPDSIAMMGRNARTHYETHYTAEKNYAQLMTIYESVLSEVVACR